MSITSSISHLPRVVIYTCNPTTSSHSIRTSIRNRNNATSLNFKPFVQLPRAINFNSTESVHCTASNCWSLLSGSFSHRIDPLLDGGSKPATPAALAALFSDGAERIPKHRPKSPWRGCDTGKESKKEKSREGKCKKEGKKGEGLKEEASRRARNTRARNVPARARRARRLLKGERGIISKWGESTTGRDERGRGEKEEKASKKKKRRFRAAAGNAACLWSRHAACTVFHARLTPAPERRGGVACNDGDSHKQRHLHGKEDAIGCERIPFETKPPRGSDFILPSPDYSFFNPTFNPTLLA